MTKTILEHRRKSLAECNGVEMSFNLVFLAHTSIYNSPSLIGSSQRLGGLITLQREDEALAEGRGLGRVLPPQCSDNQPNAGDNERDAEQLPHIEEHTLFELLLDVLDELDAEAAAEDQQEETAEQETGTLACVVFLVEPGIDEEDHQVAEGFIELRGVRRCREDRVATSLVGTQVGDETEGPRHVGLVTVNLVIEEVADADQGCHRRYRNTQSVQNKEGRQLILLGIDQHRQEDTQRATVTGQTTLPRHEYFHRMREIIVGVVEKTMSQSGADERTEETIQEKRIYPFWILAVQLVILLHQLHANEKADDEHQRIPTQSDWPPRCTERNDDRMSGPSDDVEHIETLVL